MAFLLLLGEGVKKAFLKQCEAAYVPFATRVVDKIWQGGRFWSEEFCCKN